MRRNEYLNLYTAKDLAHLNEKKDKEIKELKNSMTIGIVRKLQAQKKIADTLHLQASEKIEELRQEIQQWKTKLKQAQNGIELKFCPECGA